MSSLEQLEKELSVELKMLTISKADIPKAINSKKDREIERVLNKLTSRIETAHNLKTQIQQKRFESDESLEQVQEWSDGIDHQIEPFMHEISLLESESERLKEEKRSMEAANEEANTRKILKEKFEGELRLEEEKIKMRAEYDRKLLEERTNMERDRDIKDKLPKLQITKFQGTHLDWLRFWGQFETEIDKSKLTPVAKLSYLKELLIPKARQTIDGLPFTSEGYARAISVLKVKYGKTSEVTNAHIQCILSLPTIHSSNARKIHEFYETLSTHVQYLETIKKLDEIKGYARSTLDKLPSIRADLTRLDEHWQDWGFRQLIENIRKWVERNPIQDTIPAIPKQEKNLPSRVLQTSKNEPRMKACIYCSSKDHNSNSCDKVTNVEERIKIIEKNQLCFNCTGRNHNASQCHSKRSCIKCNKRHHTSICKSSLLTATENSYVCHPTIIVKVNGQKCRALLDTGAGNSYASSTLIELINTKPSRIEHRNIEMMMSTAYKKLEVHKITITNIEGDFSLSCEVNKVDKQTLLTLPNPRLESLIRNYSHLQHISIEQDNDRKPELPVHLIIGASEYAQIKMPVKPAIGKPGEPIAERTKFGWTFMSGGVEREMSSALFLKSSEADYHNLCSLDVLGLEDDMITKNSLVYDNFKEQLVQTKEGWYETNLLWKLNHSHLPTNETGSLIRFQTLLRQLKNNPDLFRDYNQIIEDQIRDGIVEDAPAVAKGKEYYIPHKAVIREDAETTKIRIVYDASAKGQPNGPSLNDCLETGPTLQNLLWTVLVRTRWKPVALCGDMKKAFHQIRIREEDRDSLRFFWITNCDPSQQRVLRFTRAVFGLTQSPFFLGGTVACHLNNVKDRYPAHIIEAIEKDLYVDDLITGGKEVEDVLSLKENAINIFAEAGFTLHKWHSNLSILEDKRVEKNVNTYEDDKTFAKQQLGGNSEETKILGMHWNKEKDQMSVKFNSSEEREPTKRNILSKLAAIYDPLGITSPVLLQGKIIYRQSCELKQAWDKELPKEIAKKWEKWERSLPEKISVPRSLIPYKVSIKDIFLHSFSDASKEGTAAAVYVTVYHSEGISQGLITAKARLSKQHLSIPRLELISAQIATRLMNNVKETLQHPVNKFIAWSDSTVVLHWLRADLSLKQFVNNRVREIKESKFIEWRYVPTKMNPADVASRGCTFENLPAEWLKGPKWLPNMEKWPSDIITKSTPEAEKEVKLVKDLFALAVKQQSEFIIKPENHSFKKFIRVSCWISRFLTNAKGGRVSGPLNTEEITSQIQSWIKRTQQSFTSTEEFLKDQEQLNLQTDDEGIYRCYGRIQGQYPTYLPYTSSFTRKLVEDAHIKSLHGGVAMTMASVREKYWVPKLRQMTKSVIHSCYGCKRFRVKAYPVPPPGQLPLARTQGCKAFNVVGVDYAGPIMFKARNNRDEKSYLLLFSCSLSRGVHLELVSSLTAEEFIRCFKRFVSRRGRPTVIYSDNAKTFEAASSWLKKVRMSEKFHQYLADKEITWRFNLSRAPWWGGQFERLIGVAKQSIYRTIKRTSLNWVELEEVLLDVEEQLNNRPLTYLEDDVQLPTLTPNKLIFGEENFIPDTPYDFEEDKLIRKRYKYIETCKQQVWKRWSEEYLRALRERHNMKAKKNKSNSIFKLGDIVLVKSENKNRGQWCMGKIKQLFQGKDGFVRAVSLQVGQSTLQRAVQHLYPMELSSDVTENEKTDSSAKLEVQSKIEGYNEQTKRNAAEKARLKILDQALIESNEPDVA